MIPQLHKNSFAFPNPTNASEEGIVAWGGDLEPARIYNAYQNGIFPWYGEDEPILWWSPNPRLIMELDDFKLSKSLKKSMKKFTYKFDTNFLAVMQKCATIPRKDQDGTWIQPEVIEAYTQLHQLGIAHSVESYLDGELVGGLYGVVVGGVFCGESMFSYVSDASKSAYATLVKHLKVWGYDFIDCQVPTTHLKSLGAKEVHREYFLQRLEQAKGKNIKHLWEII
ncbi:Leucyl/phenylalanyl-tRNA--protein transferase [hydrothermal vent metagenome]|uniref:Leucyl/phenylalanyl-tRNA--protein transferase n=1 Tax=hydrothermal vent metagenome TaxID=652676 RepID=A0A1W1D5R6_9ZZZZ